MKKGNTFLEVIVSLVCIMTLMLPILKTINLISKDRAIYYENNKIIEIMDDTKYIIQDSISDSDLEKHKKVDEYDIFIKEDEKIKEDLYRYKVEIKKDDTIKSTYYIIKRY